MTDMEVLYMKYFSVTDIVVFYMFLYEGWKGQWHS